MKYNEQAFARLSKCLLAIAVIMILFSLFAPIIFTNYYSKWNFAETGQIGDTIGGIMNPFIAIGGVCATFLAFFMQIQANKIQSDQFIKSLNKGAVDEKIDCYYKLDLMKTDLDIVIKDIKDRVNSINGFTESVENDPYKFHILQRPVLKNYDRIATLNRLSIYKGFKIFLSDCNWIFLFNRLHSNLDYIPVAFKSVYEIIDRHNSDIYKDKENIRNMLLNLDNKCAECLRIGLEQYNKNAFEIFICAFRKEINESLEEKRESDLKTVKDILYTFYRSLINSELSISITDIIVALNYIEQKGDNLLVGFISFKEDMNSVNKSIKEIKEKIKSAVEATSVYEIRKEYYSSKQEKTTEEHTSDINNNEMDNSTLIEVINNQNKLIERLEKENAELRAQSGIKEKVTA